MGQHARRVILCGTTNAAAAKAACCSGHRTGNNDVSKGKGSKIKRVVPGTISTPSIPVATLLILYERYFNLGCW
jgi:hypothetical protein